MVYDYRQKFNDYSPTIDVAIIWRKMDGNILLRHAVSIQSKHRTKQARAKSVSLMQDMLYTHTKKYINFTRETLSWRWYARKTWVWASHPFRWLYWNTWMRLRASYV